MKYRVKVDRAACIADSVCYAMDPDHYEEGDEGKALAVGGKTEGDISIADYDDDNFDAAQEAADACPVEAIVVEKL